MPLQSTSEIYFDYAASTPVDSEVIATITQALTNSYANPSSPHKWACIANQQINKARKQVTQLINATESELIWTASATEANNLAIIGLAQAHPNKDHIITSSIEHKSLLASCEALKKTGTKVTYIEPDSNGIISTQKIKSAIKPTTLLVSVMHINNETGTIQDIESIAKLCKKENIYFHSDAAQSSGKIPINVRKTPIDLLSLSAHKIYGPKGIGALFINKKTKPRLQTLIHGGGHEQNLRSGTLATHQISGMGKAFEIAQSRQASDLVHLNKLRDYFVMQLKKLPCAVINVDTTKSFPGIINLRFNNIDNELLLNLLPELMLTPSSACTLENSEPSHVLKAIGLTRKQINNSIRFSFGRQTTTKELDYAIMRIIQQTEKILKGNHQ